MHQFLVELIALFESVICSLMWLYVILYIVIFSGQWLNPSQMHAEHSSFTETLSVVLPIQDQQLSAYKCMLWIAISFSISCYCVIGRGVFCREPCFTDAFVITQLREQYKRFRHRQPVISSSKQHSFYSFIRQLQSATGPNCMYMSNVKCKFIQCIFVKTSNAV